MYVCMYSSLLSAVVSLSLSQMMMMSLWTHTHTQAMMARDEGGLILNSDSIRCVCVCVLCLSWEKMRRLPLPTYRLSTYCSYVRSYTTGCTYSTYSSLGLGGEANSQSVKSVLLLFWRRRRVTSVHTTYVPM